MQSILRWSIENSTPQDVATPVVHKNLDPGIIDYILGKPDSEQMKDDLAVAIDSNKSEEERVEALDHLEMVCGMAMSCRSKVLTIFVQLVEQIDNANGKMKYMTTCCLEFNLCFVDLEKLNLWEPLQSLLIATTSSQGIKSHALWIIGTAVQNNPAAQDAVSGFQCPRNA